MSRVSNKRRPSEFGRSMAPPGLIGRCLLTQNCKPPRIASMSLQMNTTTAGLRFIFEREVGPFRNITARLHWPGGASGVTLGPGYDMKERSTTSVSTDLQAIGIAQKLADDASQGAGLTDQSAKDFARDNAQLLTLTDEQQTALLRHIIGKYEAIVNRNVHIALSPYEFDALVSFVYNPGGSFLPVAEMVNVDDMETAAEIIRTRVTSKGKVMQGLVRRREHEIRLLLNGSYW